MFTAIKLPPLIFNPHRSSKILSHSLNIKHVKPGLLLRNWTPNQGFFNCYSLNFPDDEANKDKSVEPMSKEKIEAQEVDYNSSTPVMILQEALTAEDSVAMNKNIEIVASSNFTISSVETSPLVESREMDMPRVDNPFQPNPLRDSQTESLIDVDPHSISPQARQMDEYLNSPVDIHGMETELKREAMNEHNKMIEEDRFEERQRLKNRGPPSPPPQPPSSPIP